MKPLLALFIAFAIFVSSRSFADDAPAANSTALTAEAQNIVSSSKTLAQAVSAADAALGSQATTVAGTLSKYSDDQEGCRSKASIAMTYCLEATNPGIAKALPVIQTLMAGLTAASVVDACSTIGKVLSVANDALLLYQTTCAAAKGVCNYSCSGDVTTLNNAKTQFAKITKSAEAACKTKYATNAALAQSCITNIETPLKSLNASITKDTDAKQDSSVAQKNSTCSSYTAQLASALTGTIGVVKSMSDANKCEAATTTTPTPTATPLDCTLAANAENLTCICQNSPRTAGCASGLDTTASALQADSLRAASTAGAIAATGSTMTSLGTDGATDLGAATTTSSTGSGADTSSAPGSPIDSSDSVGNGTDSGTKAQQKAAGLNTNIYGGETGGGGGGGGYGYGGGSDDRDSLRQYLPGGIKDPTKAMAAQAQATKKEVTSESGKSNWEKVRDRYHDQKNTLIEY